MTSAFFNILIAQNDFVDYKIKNVNISIIRVNESSKIRDGKINAHLMRCKAHSTK